MTCSKVPLKIIVESMYLPVPAVVGTKMNINRLINQ